MDFEKLLRLHNLEGTYLSRFDRSRFIISDPTQTMRSPFEEISGRLQYRLGAFVAIDFNSHPDTLVNATELAKQHLIRKIFSDVLFLMDEAIFEVKHGTEESAIEAILKAKCNILDFAKN